MLQITPDFFEHHHGNGAGHSVPARTPRILFAAGGTGGHIMPALATADAVRQLAGGAECFFVCGRKEVEKVIYKQAGQKPFLLSMDSVTGSLGGRVKRYRQMIESIWKAHRAVKKSRPDAVIAFGGYTAAPVILAARWHGVPIYLQEQNAVPGRVNRLFSIFAERVFIGCPFARRFFADKRVINTGTPIRLECVGQNRSEARRHFKAGDADFLLLVIGGSQGAAGLNRLLREALAKLAGSGGKTGRQLMIVWATGAGEFGKVCAEVERDLHPNVEKSAHDEKRYTFELGGQRATVLAVPFLGEMGKAYAAADLVVGRAGAGSVAEILANGLPSILIPYPHAADDHQRRNAELPRDEGAALLINERDASAAARLTAALEDLMSEPETLLAMRQAAERLAQPDAAAQIARVVLDDIEKQRGLVLQSVDQPQG